MLHIRLARRGKKHQPSFRLIVVEKTKDPWGDYLEDLGYYNPISKKGFFNAERIRHWLEKGAQLSGTVNNLLIREGIIKGKRVKVTKHREDKEKDAVPAITESKIEKEKPDEKRDENAE